MVVLRSPIHANEPSEYNGMLYRTSNRVLNNGIKVIILICMDGTSQYHHHPHLSCFMLVSSWEYCICKFLSYQTAKTSPSGLNSGMTYLPTVLILSGLSQFSSLKISQILCENKILSKIAIVWKLCFFGLQSHHTLRCHRTLHLGCPDFGVSNVGRYGMIKLFCKQEKYKLESLSTWDRPRSRVYQSGGSLCICLIHQNKVNNL